MTYLEERKQLLKEAQENEIVDYELEEEIERLEGIRECFERIMGK